MFIFELFISFEISMISLYLERFFVTSRRKIVDKKVSAKGGTCGLTRTDTRTQFLIPTTAVLHFNVCKALD